PQRQRQVATILQQVVRQQRYSNFETVRHGHPVNLLQVVTRKINEHVKPAVLLKKPATATVTDDRSHLGKRLLGVREELREHLVSKQPAQHLPVPASRPVDDHAGTVEKGEVCVLV